MSWEGTKAGGTPLFESDVFTISSVSVGAFVLQPIEVNTHQLPLLAGNSYVAFLFALGAEIPPAVTDWSLNTLDPYSGGGWAISNVGSDFGALTRIIGAKSRTNTIWLLRCGLAAS